MPDYKDLEQYGIIGNLETCALIGDDGSIDWCCFPHIESPSVFAAILDHTNGGRFSITPAGDYKTRQEYLGETNVLQTFFETDDGTAVLTDFMPVKTEADPTGQVQRAVYRRVACTSGAMAFDLDFSPRFNYALDATILSPSHGGIEASSPRRKLFLQTDLAFQLHGTLSATCSFNLTAGEERWHVLQYDGKNPKTSEECRAQLDKVLKYWNDWIRKASGNTALFEGPWRDLVVRSGLVLKLLSHEKAGAICAAPTTSLPESIGGARNWDYRYNWIRDASFTVQALYNLGHYEEARNHLRWFVDICEKDADPSKIQIMYGMHGETDLRETELGHLEGYRKSRPVRIGNGAAKQKQLDIFGELINAIYETERYGIPDGRFQFVMRIVDYVCEMWDTPDSGIWEVRGGPRHFVYSKLMCWVAVDRGIKIAEHRKYRAPLEKWREIRDEIKRAILENGYNEALGSFVQSFGSTTLDATSLIIPITGFLPVDDPRVQGTINKTLEKLTTGSGLVYRYIGDDGLSGKEGAFLLCSFWLVKALALSGRTEEAEKILNKVVKFAGGAGLFSEEVDPETGKQLGNLPQAFSHIGLINSVLYLGHMAGKSHAGPTPMGAEKSGY
jgi:GH15 family glucan-1,4-alpha-glucosidase